MHDNNKRQDVNKYGWDGEEQILKTKHGGYENRLFHKDNIYSTAKPSHVAPSEFVYIYLFADDLVLDLVRSSRGLRIKKKKNSTH